MSDITLPSGVIAVKPYKCFFWRNKKVDLRTATPELILKIAADPKNSILALKEDKNSLPAPKKAPEPAESEPKKASK